MKALTVSCVGGAVLDVIYRVDQLPSSDTKLVARSRVESGGGMAANAAAAIARLGGNARWIGRVGDDDMANHIVSGLETSGVHVTARRICDATSPHSIVLVDQRGDRAIVLYRSTDFDADAQWLPLDMICQANVVLADNRWVAGAVRALDAARARGLPAVLDADISDDPQMILAVKAASHVVFSEQGLAGLFGTADPLEGLKRAAVHAPFVAVTLGGAGVAWLDAERQPQHLRAFPVTARETLGAGDVFHGAFALALAERRTESEALRFAAVTAALKCERTGGRSTFPNRSEVDERLLHTW
ncbi:PfkB family carbohydrate kinase [Variovorax sp. E3]|uniref:PfkB family carbohydrate kinase n=1 Tax=Variovorax sp. E3 TaxID=1914993 RepID=UPI0018DEC80A|nr:PfkB family carbohydrate kinase [Variovorax sp. E3]